VAGTQSDDVRKDKKMPGFDENTKKKKTKGVLKKGKKK